MSENVIIAIIGACGGSAVTAIINAITGNRKERRLLLSNTGANLRMLCEKAIDRGSIDFIELRQINEMNDEYHAAGGNGFVKSLIQKVNALPIVDD